MSAGLKKVITSFISVPNALFKKVGQLQIENDFLKKVLGK